MQFLAWLEQTGVSTWLRESTSLLVFPLVISLHTVGMGFLAGTNVAMDLRILGVGSRMPLSPMQKFFPVMWIGFTVNALSGVALLIAYPTKALTNPVFYVKLALIALGMTTVRLLRTHVFADSALDGRPVSRKAKLLAGGSLFCWAGTITAGRLLAYTYTHLLAGD